MRLMTAVLIDEHVHEKVFNDRIAELLALLVIKESALYFEGLLFPHCQRPHVDCKMKNNNYIIVILLCFTHYKLGILPHVHLLYILSLCTCYNISVVTSLTRRVLHCMCECMKIGYMYL